jgi:hypothetical protein
MTNCRSVRELILRSPLAAYVGKGWGLGSGLSHVADFDRGNFDAVATLVPPDFIFGKLRERYGAELDSPEYHHSDEVPLARRIAHQFAVIYLGIEKEKKKEADDS